MEKLLLEEVMAQEKRYVCGGDGVGMKEEE
jgi:hypothetical protein